MSSIARNLQWTLLESDSNNQAQSRLKNDSRAIDNDGPRRMDEYSAWSFRAQYSCVQFGGAAPYTQSLSADAVKPFIDELRLSLTASIRLWLLLHQQYYPIYRHNIAIEVALPFSVFTANWRLTKKLWPPSIELEVTSRPASFHLCWNRGKPMIQIRLAAGTQCFYWSFCACVILLSWLPLVWSWTIWHIKIQSGG